MSLPKEVAKVRREPSHYLKTNRAVYSISDVVKKKYFCTLSLRYNSPTTFADYPYESTLLIRYKLSIVLSFPKKFSKE